MRRTAFIIVLVSSLATVTFAQQNQLQVFVSLSPSSGVDGYGLGFNHMWSPRFSTGIGVASEDHDVRRCIGGILTTQTCVDATVRTYPVDLTGRFHFLNDTRWKPYVGAGLRYVGAPDLPREFVPVFGDPYSDRASGQVVGGVDFLIGPSFGINVEMKGLVGLGEDYDPALKVSVGLNWRF